MAEHKAPLAFFITFRCYGTWLHGDERGSTSRFRNRYGEPHLDPNEGWQEFNKQRLKHPAFHLGARHRSTVRNAVGETCELRDWSLHALNVRTNHVHIVVGSGKDFGKKVLAALKANSTRLLRNKELCEADRSSWSKGGSVRYVWDISALGDVVDYVLNEQGEEL